MAKFNEGFSNIKVKLLNSQQDFDILAKNVYTFGRFSHDYINGLDEIYCNDKLDCEKYINKVICGMTLPKFAMQGWRINFQIEGISRICLAQITRDSAIFASQGGGVFPLTQEFNIPLSLTKHEDIMELLRDAQYLLEEAYIKAAEKEIPALEARYIGLHCQTINLTASYIPSDFVRSCFSRTSSNFCDECNYVYRLMYKEIVNAIKHTCDAQSKKLLNWLFEESKCINDGEYLRESLYNSDFTVEATEKQKKKYKRSAINDWRKSGWVDELKRMYYTGDGYLTDKERKIIEGWIYGNKELLTSYDNTSSDVLVNAIKKTDYYKEHMKNAERF